MTVGGYSPRSIGNYVRELRFIFEYYPDTRPSQLSAEQIELYICYIKKVFNSGHAKCRLVASSVSFFFKQILKRPYDLPSKLYPKKKFQTMICLHLQTHRCGRIMNPLDQLNSQQPGGSK